MHRLCRHMVILFLAAAFAWGPEPAAAEQERYTTGAFTRVSKLDVELKRGQATKLDVQRVLGTPKGYGHAVLPPERKAHEVWYYEDIEVTNVKSGEGGKLHADVRQQVLLVFFLGEVFDGFMWHSNVTGAQPAE